MPSRQLPVPRTKLGGHQRPPIPASCDGGKTAFLRHCAFAQAYAKSIIVLWQKKAWVDRPTAIAHVRHKKMKDFFKKEVHGKGLINCDNLDAQIQSDFYRAVLVSPTRRVCTAAACATCLLLIHDRRLYCRVFLMRSRLYISPPDSRMHFRVHPLGNTAI